MMNRRRFCLFLMVVAVAALTAGVMVVGPSRVPSLLRSTIASVSKPKMPRREVRRLPEPNRAELVSGVSNALRLPPDVVKTLGISTAVVRAPERARSLTLSGSLALDTNRLAHVHTRFAGEVVELGTIADPTQGTDGGKPLMRPLRFGDTVEKGQLLAVLWSSDLGEKKSEYVEALSRVRMEKETLARQETLFKDEATPERNLREARRAVESTEIAVARVERTLRSWRLSEAEIAAIRTEAEAMHTKDAKVARLDPKQEKAWARVELRAPLAGTILEVNLTVGDIVATDADLFKIADMQLLRVWAYLYEEDLPTLLALPRPIRWTIRLKSDPLAPPIFGTAEKIGDLIDPNQHTALVVGQVENKDGRMRAGQFITAQVELPPTLGEMETPIAALVEDGQESVVFIQPDPAEPVYSMRKIDVTHRSGRTACVCGSGGRSLRFDASAAASRAGDNFLKPGDRVVVSGAVELRAALLGLQDDAKSTK